MDLVFGIFKILGYLIGVALVILGSIFVATGIAIGILNCIYIYG